MMKKLTPSDLRRTVDPSKLSCESVDSLKPLETIIGQQRAMKALQLGLGIRSQGFNIYVSGRPGTGKLTAVKRYIADLARKEPQPDDWCYVYNFNNPYEPRKMPLPAGKACELRDDMRALVGEARQALIKAFESEEAAAKREEIVKNVERKKLEIFSKVEKSARAQGFLIKQATARITTVPMKEKDGEAMTDKEFKALSEKQRKVIIGKQEKLLEEIKAALRINRDLEREANSKVRELEKQIAMFAVTILIDELREKYIKTADVLEYLDCVQKDILENFSEFLKPPKEDNLTTLMKGWEAPFFIRYEVNVLIDNSGLEGAPVVIELNPTYVNLFGKVEKESQMGSLYTNFTLIRKGSLHRANGGYIVIPMDELLRNFLSWDGLKRAIRNREIVIEDPGDRLGFVSTKTLKPEPVPFLTRVILIGEPLLYYLLYEYDSEFKELFKVKAEFDTSMEYSEKNVNDFLSFVCKVCQEEKLAPLDSTALAKIIEYGCRLAEHKEKISTRFGEISDIIREGSYYAGFKNGKQVTASHIVKAIDEKYYRSNLIHEKITELIRQNVIMIEHEGESIGQINGLAVSDLGDIAFGRPNRITVTTGIGSDGVIDIERESKLGGRIHSKGVMILSGFLSDKFAHDKPLSLSARLVFEQSYSEIEGDSASSAELYALLSSLSGVPIRQGIAVTGSVNQWGEVQAIGGVNEKIEGFYEVCKQKGLTGKQGVMIPESNMTNLMLREELVDAVDKGKFHIWAVSTVEEGIETLTGIKAGKQKTDGIYEKDTIYFKVNQRLNEIEKLMEKKAKRTTQKQK